MERIVEESDLDFGHFHCCGDEDLYPFGCPDCGRLMVFCYECDSLFGDLADLRQILPLTGAGPPEPAFHCPGCGRSFEYFFIRDKLYKVSLDQWVAAGFRHLLAKGVVPE